MNGWLVLAIVVVACAAIYLAQRFGWIDLSNKNANSGPRGGVMGIGDEVFNPTRHEAQIELDRQTVLPAPAPLPGDGDKGIYRGFVEIDLDDEPVRKGGSRHAEPRGEETRSAERHSAESSYAGSQPAEPRRSRRH